MLLNIAMNVKGKSGKGFSLAMPVHLATSEDIITSERKREKPVIAAATSVSVGTLIPTFILRVHPFKETHLDTPIITLVV